MSRKFKTADYEATLNLAVSIRDALPPNHLARFVVDMVAQLDLSAVYARYAPVGGEAFAPDILLALLFYGYATGVFSSRRIEKATYESLPFRFIAGNWHPDHDTLANPSTGSGQAFRKTFLVEIQELFACTWVHVAGVQILLLAQAAQVLKLGNISLDGSKIHADASKSQAVSYKRLVELEAQLRTEVNELFTLGEQADQGDFQLPDGLVIPDPHLRWGKCEIALRQERLTNLAKAKAVLEARAQERFQAEKADYEAKIRTRAETAQKTKRKPRGRAPKPPTPEPRDKDQYNFTDPESRVTPAPPAQQVRVKNGTNQGFDQHYNAQLAVTQDSFLTLAPGASAGVVASTLSNHPNDSGEALPTLDAIRRAGGRCPPSGRVGQWFL